MEVPNITTDPPIVVLQEATRELENSTEDRESQALTVPEQVGGHINVLLETHYSAHFPKPMHFLENRLGTYKVKLLTGDPHITAAIARPHRSSTMMLEKTRDTGTMLAASTQGLDHWKIFRPPSIKSIYLGTRDPDLTTALSLADIRGLDDIPE